jgi:2-polyprenyl-3-methyl-5-hydroxy-6-metoxy-1,4-benzoquinol methylase
MKQISATKTIGRSGHYDANYGNFQRELYEEIRREAFGEDIGQNSWLTTDEHDRFLSWLDLTPGKAVLDIASGAGGPALRMASVTGCAVVGVDVHEQAIATACSLAAERDLTARVEFRVVDASRQLPFAGAQFDVITCIDAINHLPERAATLREWTQLLKPGGRLLFTDPTVITGPLTNEEIAVRSSAGFYLFVPPDYDQRILEECGLRLMSSENRTLNMAEIAERRRKARESRSTELLQIEGNEAYESQQEFLSVAARLAKEGRLSRFAYVAERV